MISNNNFRILTSEEESQYKFPFCCPCEFYPCELVGECGSVNEIPEIHESQIPILRGRIVATSTEQSKNTEKIYMAKAVSPVHDKYDGDTIADTSHSHSTSPDAHRAIPLSYDQEEFKTDCIMSSFHVCQIECGQKRVSEGIGEHFKIETNYDGTIRENIDGKWEPLQPVFISAQTGQGKNYFVENVLIPYVRELNYKNRTNQKVLIFSNRRALQYQMWNRLNGNDENDDSDNIDEKVYHYEDIADVMTYQSLLHREKSLRKKQKNPNSKYIYVICDEAHFFTSDALFNPDTKNILSAIVQVFQDAVRVYMSATPYECLKYIINAEDEYKEKYLNWNKPQHKWASAQMVFYHFKRNYDYLDIKTYFEFDKLYEKIVASVNEKKERWLIFIDDKEKCSAVKEQLLISAEIYAKDHGTHQILEGKRDDDASGPKPEKILVVDAKSKKNRAYQSMVKNEALDKETYVLISTSVLDNGVNLNNINNIVVSDMSRTKCLQMVGRARVGGPDDRKTLYLRIFGSKYTKMKIDSFKEHQDAYHRYALAYEGARDLTQSAGYSKAQFLSVYYDGYSKNRNNAKHWFGRSTDNPDKLYLNEIAKSMVDKLVPQYQAIFDEMMKDYPSDKNLTEAEKERRSGLKYLEYQLSWFGKVHCVDDDITLADKDKEKKAFVTFLESYAEGEVQIDKENQKQRFRPEFTRLYDAAFGRADPNKDRNYGITKMNLLLEDAHINYTVVSYSSYWIVQEHDWETEEE